MEIYDKQYRWKALKLIFALLILTLSFVQKCEAQSEWFYGPRIGMSFSTFSGNDVKDNSYPMNALVGIYGQKQLSEKYSICAEMHYFTTGSNFRDKDSAQLLNKASLGYIAMPIYTDRYFGQFHFQAGVQFQLLLNAISDKNLSGKSTNSSSLTGYHRFDAGPVIGLFYQFPQGFQIGLRYYRGCVPVFRDNSSFYNSCVQVLLGFKFSPNK